MHKTIRLFSDVICPFCFIAEQTVMKEIEAKNGADFLWLGMELHPETPMGGILINDARYNGFREYVQKFARDFGMDGLRLPEYVYNTQKLLLVAEYARAEDKLGQFRKNAYTAYWQENANIEDTLILGEIAVASGLESNDAMMAIDNIGHKMTLEKRRYNALQLGIQTLPGFMWGTKAIIGCQPYREFEKAFEKD